MTAFLILSLHVGTAEPHWHLDGPARAGGLRTAVAVVLCGIFVLSCLAVPSAVLSSASSHCPSPLLVLGSRSDSRILWAIGHSHRQAGKTSRIHMHWTLGSCWLAVTGYCLRPVAVRRAVTDPPHGSSGVKGSSVWLGLQSPPGHAPSTGKPTPSPGGSRQRGNLTVRLAAGRRPGRVLFLLLLLPGTGPLGPLSLLL